MDKSRKIEVAIAAIVAFVAIIALIPAFGQWLCPRTPVPNSMATSVPTQVVVASATMPSAMTPTRPMATPTQTGERVPTASPLSTFYDDFNNPSFGNSYNSDLWLRKMSGQCQVAQQNGVMVFANTASADYINCIIVARILGLVSFENLNVIQANIKVPSQFENSEKIEQVVRFTTTDFPNGEWWAACGLVAESNEVKFTFNVFLDDYAKTGEHPEFLQTLKASYDTWYTMRLEIGTDKAIRCYANNDLVGELRSQYEIELQKAHYELDLIGYRTPNAVGTTLVDDVQISFRK